MIYTNKERNFLQFKFTYHIVKINICAYKYLDFSKIYRWIYYKWIIFLTFVSYSVIGHSSLDIEPHFQETVQHWQRYFSLIHIK
jgi:hypothetical protein